MCGAAWWAWSRLLGESWGKKTGRNLPGESLPSLRGCEGKELQEVRPSSSAWPMWDLLHWWPPYTLLAWCMAACSVPGDGVAATGPLAAPGPSPTPLLLLCCGGSVHLLVRHGIAGINTMLGSWSCLLILLVSPWVFPCKVEPSCFIFQSVFIAEKDISVFFVQIEKVRNPWKTACLRSHFLISLFLLYWNFLLPLHSLAEYVHLYFGRFRIFNLRVTLIPNVVYTCLALKC